MNRPKESSPSSLRFSLRHLLLVMTIASILMGVATLLPREALRFLIRLVDLGFVAGLVAAVMVWEGRWKIACVATLIPLAIAALGDPAFGALFRGFPSPLRGLGGIQDIATLASRWAEALISGTVAYVVAGRLAHKK